MLEDSRFLQWREHSFLENPRTPMQLRWATTTLSLSLPGINLPDAFATGPHAHALGEGALKRAAAALKGVRVLRIAGLHPGSFQGFERPGDNDAFNAWFQRMMSDQKWCCSTQVGDFKQRRFDALFYATPYPLRAGAEQLWKVRLCVGLSGHKPIRTRGLSAPAPLLLNPRPLTSTRRCRSWTCRRTARTRRC